MESKKVIIAGDQDNVSEWLSESLKKLGCESVHLVKKVSNILESVLLVKPDLVFLDIEFGRDTPGVNIIDLISSRADAPVVFISPKPDDRIIEKVKINKTYGFIRYNADVRDVRTVTEIALFQYQMEKKLRLSEAKYKAVVDALTEGIFVFDKDLTIINANPTALEIFEAESDLIGKRIGTQLSRKIYTDHDINIFNDINRYFYQLYENTKLHDQNYEVNLRLVTKKGDNKYLRVIFKYMRTYNATDDDFWICSFRDITSKYITDQNLTDSEERMRSVFVNSYDGYALTDEKGNLVEWNPAMTSLTGVSRNTVLGMKIWDINSTYGLMLKSAGEPREIKEIYENFYRTGEAPWLNTVFEFVIRKYSGEIATIQKVVFRIRTRKGWVLCSVNRELTELLHQRKARIESENRLNLVLESGNDAIWDLNPYERVILFLSPKWYTMLGYIPDDMPHDYETFMDFIHEEDRPKVDKLMQDIVDKKIEQVNFECRLRTADGLYKWVLIRGKADLCDENGNVSRVIGTNIDIDAKKKIELALAESEQVMATILSASPVGICMVKESKMLWANSQLMDFFGYDQQSIINMDVYLLCKTNDVSVKTFKQIRKEVYSKGFSEKEITLYTSTGEPRACMLWAKVINSDNIQNGIIVALRDITEKKIAEEQQKQIQQLTYQAERSKNEAEKVLNHSGLLASIGVITSSFTHEINQPLNAIRLGADGLLFWNKQNNVLPEIIAEMLDGISDATTKIDDLVKHLRKFCLDTSSNEFSIFDVNESLKKSVSIVSQKMHNAEIKIKVETPPYAVYIKANSLHLELMINNLLVNATESLANVTLHDKWVHVRSYEYKESAYIEISDNGNGLLNADMNTIFDPFSSDSENEKNVFGLGLSIVKMFVEKFKAEITAEPLPVRGERFLIRFDKQSNE